MPDQIPPAILKRAAKRFIKIFILAAFLAGSLVFYVTYNITRMDRIFHDDLYEAAEEAGGVLVSEGICKAIKKECGGKVYFVTASDGGGHIEIYGVNDIEVLEKFSNPFFKKFFDVPEMNQLVITSYVHGKEQIDKRFFAKNEINFKVKMERAK